MAVKLSGEQEQTVKTVLQVADARGATPMERLAAVLAIGAEANYGNPAHGDRDSLGAFQQRASWGSRSSRLNVAASAERFFDRAKQLRQSHSYGRAGELAQAVQVSARPGAYEAQRPIALQILKQVGGGGTGLAADLNAPAGSSSQEFDPARGQVSALEVQRPVAPAGTAPAPPAAAALAQPVMPAAYPGAPASGGVSAPAPEPVTSTPDYSQAFDRAPVDSGSSGGAAAAGAASGAAAPHVKIAAGANLAGRPIGRDVLGLVDEISSASGQPITITTGTNHKQFVKGTNRVSDHYGGNAVDIAARGQALTDGATDALLTVARGKTVQWIRNDLQVVNVRLTAANTRKLVEAGGIFNVPDGKRRIQVIANTHQGGDHTNHYHIGLS